MAHEPGRIAFAAPQSTTAAQQATEPRALSFPSPPPEAANGVEPGALVFGAAPSKGAVPGPAASAPRAVDFSTVSTKPAPRDAGASAFEQQAHPLRGSALQKCAELSPDLTRGNEARLSRMFAELLPLACANIESFGAHALDQCRVHAENAAQWGQFHAKLGAAEALQAALTATQPRSGLKSRLQGLLSEPVEVHRARLESLRPQLMGLLADIRRVRPEVLADGQRLALSLLALRSLREVTGTSPDAVLDRAIVRRLETLRVALAQAELVPAMMTAQESTLSLQVTECDRLLNVTFSAVAATQQAALLHGKR